VFARAPAKAFAAKKIPDNDGDEAEERCRFNKDLAAVK
jgi:hypothetical protein